MQYPKIKKLYKYREFDERNIKMLVDKQIWFSRPSDFNDPFDCNLVPALSKTEADRQIQVSKIIDRLYSPDKAKKAKQNLEALDEFTSNEVIEDKSLQAHFEEAKSMGIYSLSETSKQLLMWAHYARNHTGFCIEYARDDIKHNFLNHCMCRPVNYSLKYPNLNQELDTLGVNIYTKSKDWEYEKEWRLVSKRDGIEIMPAPMTGIIFGLKMKPENKIHIVKKLLGNVDVKFYECVQIPDQFALDVVEYKI